QATLGSRLYLSDALLAAVNTFRPAGTGGQTKFGRSAQCRADGMCRIHHNARRTVVFGTSDNPVAAIFPPNADETPGGENSRQCDDDDPNPNRHKDLRNSEKHG